MVYILMLAMLGSQTMSQFERYQSLEPLNLPGSSLLRTDLRTAELIGGRWANWFSALRFIHCPIYRVYNFGPKKHLPHRYSTTTRSAYYR